MIRWGRITIEIIFLVLVVSVVIVTTNMYGTPIIPSSIQLPLTNFCQVKAPFLDATDGIGVVNVKTSPTDTTGEYIGLSEGKFAFNTLGPDGVPKCQASQALNQGNVKLAEAFWTKSLLLQSNDAEVLIYLENQRILDAHLPSIAVVVGVVATETSTSNVLDVLQGSYTAQKRYNQDHPDAPQVRLIIANFGSTGTNTNLVAKQIIAVSKQDQQIEAMMDLPALANTAEVIQTLAQGDFPIVLSSGSTSNLQNGGNFFHVEATTQEQGFQAAKYVEQNCPNLSDEQQPFDCHGSNIAVFIDDATDDEYSSTLALAFQEQLVSDAAARKSQKMVTLISYSSTNTSSITDKVKAFGNSPPSLIYFAGSAVDANILIESFPKTAQYANLRVLGGDELYQAGKYQAGAYRHLNFTAFAYPDEWSILEPTKAVPNFFCDYAKNFAGGMVSYPVCTDWPGSLSSKDGITGYSYSRPENDVILSYDALEVILKGDELVGANGGAASRANLLTEIPNIYGSRALEGVSGRISFGNDGNPSDKTILILRVDEHGYTREEKSYGTF